MKDVRKRMTRREYKRMCEDFEDEGFMALKGLWNSANHRNLEERGAVTSKKGGTACCIT